MRSKAAALLVERNFKAAPQRRNVEYDTVDVSGANSKFALLVAQKRCTVVTADAQRSVSCQRPYFVVCFFLWILVCAKFEPKKRMILFDLFVMPSTKRMLSES